MITKTLLLVTTVDSFIISHRLGIVQEAAKQGWNVYVAAADTGRSDEIIGENITFIDFRFSRSGTNLLKEIKTLANFRKLYKKVEPDVVHHITLKPVIYGTIAAKLLGIKGVVNAISGLGYNFTDGRKGPVQKVMVNMMKYGFNRDNLSLIFQNKEDQAELEQFGVISSANNIVRIKGSGVDLKEFAQSPFPPLGRVKILFPTRMLWDKGAKELREATELLKPKYKERVTFILAGPADDGNRAGVPKDYLEDWQDGAYVKWIGYQTEMVPVYQNSHIVVLPSYREGMPRTLIEACAIGRPIVTTHAIGCRECVEEGVNGFKVPVKDSASLAEALVKLIDNAELREEMGKAGRRKAEVEFDVDNVVKKHLEIYDSLLQNKKLVNSIC